MLPMVEAATFAFEAIVIAITLSLHVVKSLKITALNMPV